MPLLRAEKKLYTLFYQDIRVCLDYCSNMFATKVFHSWKNSKIIIA